jgi:hypothetical protein
MMKWVVRGVGGFVCLFAMESERRPVQQHGTAMVTIGLILCVTPYFGLCGFSGASRG